MLRVIIVRHGQKNGDHLTPLGAKQAFAAGQAFAKRFGQIDHFISSSTQRTGQVVRIIASAMGQLDAEFEVDDSFHYGDVVEATGGEEAFFADLPKIREAGNTLDVALEISAYAVAARQKLMHALKNLVAEGKARKGETVLVGSHSPYAEMAMLDLKSPFGIGECDAVLYVLKKGEIITSELIKAPIKGEKNT